MVCLRSVQYDSKMSAMNHQMAEEIKKRERLVEVIRDLRLEVDERKGQNDMATRDVEELMKVKRALEFELKEINALYINENKQNKENASKLKEMKAFIEDQEQQMSEKDSRIQEMEEMVKSMKLKIEAMNEVVRSEAMARSRLLDEYVMRGRG
eukprot:TRINITY_DN5005_c1_g1_i2.p1 TRINITY_DN5005_c1_g1~~TRINITY_DN5005_c1_g1_i2.p1  ORF type:complete len:153 (-),score=58.25 TRINITY_DN5005_c1_g1_i2:464-922(-)